MPDYQSDEIELADADETGTFLRAAEFVSLAISRRKLLRADEPRLGVRGLIDPVTGDHYRILSTNLRRP